MCVHRVRQTQQLLQYPLARRTAQKVRAANDMSDVLARIVDSDCKLIGEEPIAPSDDEIADLTADIVACSALDAILETDGSARYSQPHCQVSSGVANTVAAPTRIPHFICVRVGGLGRLNLGSTARTEVSLTGRNQLLKRGRIKGCPSALADHGLSPLKTQQAQAFNDAISAARYLTGGVHVFDADKPLATHAARVEIAAERSNERTEMKITGGGRGKPAAIPRAGGTRAAGCWALGAGQKESGRGS